MNDTAYRQNHFSHFPKTRSIIISNFSLSWFPITATAHFWLEVSLFLGYLLAKFVVLLELLLHLFIQKQAAIT